MVYAKQIITKPDSVYVCDPIKIYTYIQSLITLWSWERLLSIYIKENLEVLSWNHSLHCNTTILLLTWATRGHPKITHNKLMIRTNCTTLVVFSHKLARAITFTAMRGRRTTHRAVYQARFDFAFGCSSSPVATIKCWHGAFLHTTNTFVIFQCIVSMFLKCAWWRVHELTLSPGTRWRWRGGTATI